MSDPEVSAGSYEIMRLRHELRKRPRDQALHRSLGFLLWRDRQYLDALIEFRKVLRLDPANTEARFALAALFHVMNKRDKTFETLFDIEYTGSDESFEINPQALDHRFADFPPPYRDIDWLELFREAEAAVRDDHGFLDRSVKTGYLCLEQKCYDKAIRIFTRLVMLAPRHAEVRLHRAVALSVRRRDREAEREFAEVLLLQPLNAAAYKGLALLRARRGETEKAIAAFEEVLKLDPDDPDARRWVEKKRAEAS